MKNLKETDTHIVVEFVNNSGSKYEVGYPKAAGYTKESIEEEIDSSEKKSNLNAVENSDYKSIHWTVNGDSNTSREAIDLGIVGGYVKKDKGIIYDCQVNFANNGGWGFTFKDQTNDTYYCSTPKNGNHYINYNSNHPTMIGVK